MNSRINISTSADTDTDTETVTDPDGRGASAEPVIALSGVSKAIGGHQVLRDVSLTLREGEVYGLLGPNGAGKTTTFRIILGLFQPDEGSVRVFGKSPRNSDLADVGVVFEYETLKPSWTVWDNLLMTCHVHELPPARIESCLERVQLGPSVANMPFDTLSKGMKRKVSLADALLSEPDVLVLDEPASGLDPESREAVLQLVESSDQTILFSSHVLSDVQRVCDRVGIVRDGCTVVETGLGESLQVFREPHPELATERLAPDADLYLPTQQVAESDNRDGNPKSDEQEGNDSSNITPVGDSPETEQIGVIELYFALTEEGERP